MPQLPEQIRPYVAAIAKYHFWILAAIVPLVLLPMLFNGQASLDSRIAAQKSQIESRVASLRGVQGITEHPNESWSKAIEKQTTAIRDQTLAEWSRFWSDQKPLRSWPPRLGEDFLKAVYRLKPDGKLERPFLLRYQNTVPDLVRELPQRMGAEDLMLDAQPGAAPVAPRGARPGPSGEFGGVPGQPRPGRAARGPTALVEWRAEDQKKLIQSFSWTKAPSTAQVLLAQEELWIYGLLCDAIKRANAGATAPFDALIVGVEELAVGYPAAEDRPGGQGGSRVILAAPVAAAPGEMPPGGMPQGGGMPTSGMPGMEEATGPATRPPHPRFGGGGSGMAMPGGVPMPEGAADGAAAAASPDDPLREWIYVDFNGKPLSAAELATVPDARLVHLVPFTMRLVMDQRRIDALMADLAAAPVPVDVRQVRINVAAQAGAPGAAGFGGQSGSVATGGPRMSEGAGQTRRPYDVIVELRGTVGLATLPDAAALGGGEPADGEGGI
ncbi:MAG: hypothetical protein ACKOC8_11965 [Pirellulales bacterium]